MASPQNATVAMMRAMVAMGLADGAIGAQERAAIKRLYRMAAGVDLEDGIIDLVARDLTNREQALREVMAASAEDLDEVKKRRVIQSAYFVMIASGDVSEKQAACLLALADGLGLDQLGFERAIRELDDPTGTASRAEADSGSDTDGPVQDYNGAAGPPVDATEIFLDAMFRAMIGMAVCDGPLTPEERQTIKHMFEQVEQPVDDQMIDGTVLALEQFDGSIGDMLARAAASIDPTLKPHIVQAVYFVMLSGDEIAEEETQALVDIGRGLGLTQIEFEAALAETRNLLADA